MTLAELKALSIAELQTYTELFHSDATNEQIKTVIGEDNFVAKMRYLCASKCYKHEKARKAAQTRTEALTSHILAQRSGRVTICSDFE